MMFRVQIKSISKHHLCYNLTIRSLIIPNNVVLITLKKKKKRETKVKTVNNTCSTKKKKNIEVKQ